MRTIRRPTRRAVLLASAGVPLLAACASPAVRTQSDVVDSVRRENLGNELQLVATYRTALAARPDMAAVLEPIMAAHQEHADALAAGLPDPSSAMPSQSPSKGTDVVVMLREAERMAVAMRTSSATRAVDPDLAALLSWISASEAQHVAMLVAVP